MKQSIRPSVEQWLKLFETGKAYRNLKAYRKIVELKRAGGQKENSLVIAVTPLDRETAYFTVMGGSDLQDRGFHMYIGKKGFNEMLAFFEAQKPESGLAGIESDFHFYSMNLCDREDLPWEYEKLFADLGIHFRGSGNYIYFMKYDGTYLPGLLTREEAEDILAYFPDFLNALQSYLGKKKKNPSYVIGKDYTYSWVQSESGEWKNTEAPFPMTAFEPERPEYGNRDQKRFLKKQRHNGEIWEYDHFPLENIVEDDNFKAPFFPKQAIVIDHTNEKIIGQKMTDPEEDREFDSYFLADLIMERGIPMKIRCADRIQKARLEALCETCGIQLVINPSEIMADVREQIYEMAGSSDLEAMERICSKAGIDMETLSKLDEESEDAVLEYINECLENAVRTGKISQEELTETLNALVSEMLFDDSDDWDEDDEEDFDDWDEDDEEDSDDWDEDDEEDFDGWDEDGDFDERDDSDEEEPDDEKDEQPVDTEGQESGPAGKTAKGKIVSFEQYAGHRSGKSSRNNTDHMGTTENSGMGTDRGYMEIPENPYEEDDPDWDEYPEEDEDDDEYYEKIELDSIKEKLIAIDIYYGKTVDENEQKVPVPPMKEYIPEMDIDWEKTAKLSRTLPLVNQLWLEDMAGKLGGTPDPKTDRQAYIDIIIGFLRKKPSDIKKILTKEELRLYKYLDKVRMPEHYNPFLEGEMEGQQENLVGLVSKGLIDIEYYYADDAICLELIVAHP